MSWRIGVVLGAMLLLGLPARADDDDDAAAPAAKDARPIVMAEVTALFLRVAPDIAAAWGLDAGPAMAPAASPLGQKPGAILSPEEADKLIGGLRTRPGTEMLASLSAITVSGQTTVTRQQLSVSSPRLEEDGHQGGLQSQSKTVRTDVMADLGAALTVTATIDVRKGPAGLPDVMDLELSPEVVLQEGWYETTLDGKPQRLPLQRRFSIETRVYLRSGQTFLTAIHTVMELPKGPGPNEPAAPASAIAAAAPGWVLLFITARVIGVDAGRGAPAAPAK